MSRFRSFADPAPWLPRLVARLPASIVAKLLAAFLTIALLLVVVGAVGLRVLGDAHRRAEELVDFQRKIAAYRQLQHDATSQLYSVAQSLVVPDDRALEATLRQLNQFGYDLDRLRFVAQGELDLLGQVQDGYNQFIQEATQVVALIRAGNAAEARERQASQLAPLADRLERLTNQLVNQAEADMVASIAESDAAHAASRGAVILFSIGSIGLALVLGYATSWSLIAPVKHMAARLGEIAAGEFAGSVHVANRDELGDLATHLNRMSLELGRAHEGRTRALEQLQQVNDRRQVELERASAIQQRLLPSASAGWPDAAGSGIDVAWRFRPAVETSGDFYDVFAVPGVDGEAPRVQIAVGDVAGKGLAAALVTAMTRSALRFVSASSPAGAATGSSPATALHLVGEQLHRDLGTQHFVACALAVMECGKDGPVLRLSNAGQVPVLLCRGAQVVELEPAGDRFPLGAVSGAVYQDLTAGLCAGDVVVFCSDGLPEAPARSDATLPGGCPTLAPAERHGELFGFPRLAQSAAHWSAHSASAEKVAAGIWSDLTAWCGEESHHDDMTLLVLRLQA